MKAKLMALALIVGFCCCQAGAQTTFSGLDIPSLPSMPENIQVNAYTQIGYQWVGANMTLPVQVSVPLFGPLSLDIGDFDSVLKDSEFWAGTVGFTALIDGKYSVFSSLGGFLNRPFIMSGETPVGLGPFSASSDMSLTCDEVNSWSFQGGFGIGPFIGGLYWDHFGFAMSEPRNRFGPLANQTIRGDALTVSLCPFIGVSIPAGGAMATLMYSPLAYSDATVVLRNSQNRFSETEYSWNEPGQLFIAAFQYNLPATKSISFGIWANYLWMSMRGDADLTFRSTGLAAPILREVEVTMGKYGYGGGLSLGYNF